MKHSVAAVLAGFALASSAHADILTFEYTANINSITEYELVGYIIRPVTTTTMPGHSVSIGDHVTGRFTIDTQTARGYTGPVDNGTMSSYSSAATHNNISAFIGHDGVNYTNALPINSYLAVQDQLPGTGADTLSLSSSQGDNLGSHIAQLTFSDPTGATLSNSAIPSSLAGLTTGEFLYRFSSIASGSYVAVKVNGAVTSLQLLSVSAVPEPQTYLMLLSGLGLLGWRRRAARRC